MQEVPIYYLMILNAQLFLYAQKCFRHLSLLSNIPFKNDEQIEDQFADLVTCNLTLEHIENIYPIFKQANKKLKKGGLFFISEFHPFKQYLGSQARFESKQETIRIKAFTHHISDFLEAAHQSEFTLVELKEWFDHNRKNDVPRLVSFVFKK